MTVFEELAIKLKKIVETLRKSGMSDKVIEYYFLRAYNIRIKISSDDKTNLIEEKEKK